ncbi:hypothetical protein TNCV_2520411 [Trichonephila clavipes]|uniref:Uncharacterized protein n=1 Tax=Trichonephila clavipes TaxID=2585209 RepID=A0A8X6V2B6_TRICX|nr:hypothetical protein TNCV_2520411 [Trichonephila clavipes]
MPIEYFLMSVHCKSIIVDLVPLSHSLMAAVFPGVMTFPNRTMPPVMSQIVKESIIEGHSNESEVMSLPPGSLDTNPIEHLWFQLKY